VFHVFNERILALLFGVFSKPYIKLSSFGFGSFDFVLIMGSNSIELCNFSTTLTYTKVKATCDHFLSSTMKGMVYNVLIG
jgi:hypothetical protein